MHGLTKVERKMRFPFGICMTTVSRSIEINLKGPSNCFVFVLYIRTGPHEGSFQTSADCSIARGHLKCRITNVIRRLAVSFKTYARPDWIDLASSSCVCAGRMRTGRGMVP